jgi:hypothetical protein
VTGNFLIVQIPIYNIYKVFNLVGSFAVFVNSVFYYLTPAYLQNSPQIKLYQMKTIFTLIIGVLYSAIAFAQQNNSCGFERLFNLKEGFSKEAVIDSISNIEGFTLLNTTAQQKKSANATTSKTAVKEMLIYSIDAAQCFRGINSKLQLEFTEGKLSKAYIQTTFASADYYEMLDNFTALRNNIKPGWEREKEIKASSGNLVSTGFDYSKAKQSNLKTDKISLQYIHTKPGNSYGIYLLQLSWINIANTGVETIVY